MQLYICKNSTSDRMYYVHVLLSCVSFHMWALMSHCIIVSNMRILTNTCIHNCIGISMRGGRGGMWAFIYVHPPFQLSAKRQSNELNHPSVISVCTHAYECPHTPTYIQIRTYMLYVYVSHKKNTVLFFLQLKVWQRTILSLTWIWGIVRLVMMGWLISHHHYNTSLYRNWT